MHVDKTKFERNSSLEYYHMTCTGKLKRCIESGASDSESPISISDLTGKQQQQQQLYFIQIST